MTPHAGCCPVPRGQLRSLRSPGGGGSPVAGPRSAESAERLPGEAIQAGLSVGCIGSTVRTKHVKRK